MFLISTTSKTMNTCIKSVGTPKIGTFQLPWANPANKIFWVRIYTKPKYIPAANNNPRLINT